MRIRNLILLIGLALLAAGSKPFWDFLRPHASDNALSAIEALKLEIIQMQKPVLTLNLDEEVRARSAPSDAELIDPNVTLPQWSKLAYAEAQALFRFSLDCDRKRIEGRELNFKSATMAKALQWQISLCQGTRLARDFFERKPYLHPSGNSYAALALAQNQPAPQNRLHLLEIVNSKLRALNLPELSSWELYNLYENESTTRTDRFVIFRASNRERLSFVFSFYSLEGVEHKLESASYRLVALPTSKSCYARERNSCWIENHQSRDRLVKIVLTGLAAALALAIIALMWIWIRQAENKKQEAAQRLFILQMLTHELRTPVTSMKLYLETLRSEFDSLPQESQKAFLRMADELQRLNRVLDASRSYLSMADQSNFLNDGAKTQTDLNLFISRIVESYSGSPVQFEALSKPAVLDVDPYWVELCIRNLIDNGLLHGKPPVIIKLTSVLNDLVITIEDQGLFDRTQRSKNGGMGLGLSLVERTVQAMGGSLTYQEQPTVFVLTLRGSS